MKTIEVKSKPYMPVNERILHLADNYKYRYSIDTNYVFYPNLRMWVVKAVLTIMDPKIRTAV